MGNYCNEGAILVAEPHTDNECWPCFSASPKSTSQTSPRRGAGIFLVIYRFKQEG